MLTKLLGYLDKPTATYFKNNTTKIVNGIDKAIDRISYGVDYATGTLRTIVYDCLVLAGVSKSYALPIADAIAAVVNFLLF